MQYMNMKDLVSCVRPIQMINNKKFMSHITPYLNWIPLDSHIPTIQACKALLHCIPSTPRVVAFWGFAPPERRDCMFDLLSALGMAFKFDSQVQEERFECLCWTTKIDPLPELFGCFNMSIDSVVIELTNEHTMYESALHRIQGGTHHTGINPREWPDTFQNTYKIGMISRMTSKDYTPENFMAMHLDLQRVQTRNRTLFYRNVNQEQEIRRLQMQYVNSFNNLHQAVHDIARAQDSLQFMTRMTDNNRAMLDDNSNSNSDIPNWQVAITEFP